ncbi:hypothetical protein IGI04_004354 [Brassica rapa subsp. trilocularis]|uniref:Uncharacterized protein n=1 Tax=Brassica rapa subsp. trilocularis TaxID=1813537 RepID=A0ABQ7NCY1_BRACM|nr:hypothetical protein IGI04_004354 [Brassica rapa subsp. trilocularis]
MVYVLSYLNRFLLFKNKDQTRDSKILKFLGLCGIHSPEPGSVVFLSAIETRGGVSWSEEHLRRREP